jgi:Spy/CpxP family protein refolding chaperone
MNQFRIFLVMLLITAAAGGLAGWAGIQYGLHRAGQQDDLDRVLHHELHLTTDQEARIAVLEKNFAHDRVGYQVEMRAANKTLATALTSGAPDDPAMESAVQRFHMAMAGLQMRTVRHVLSMRSVLTPEQKDIFDRSVKKTLGADSP